MNFQVRYSPEFVQNDMTVDPNVPFSSVTAPGHRGYGLES
jgi:hypothetical protein